jgi:hypothetical protein
MAGKMSWLKSGTVPAKGNNIIFNPFTNGRGRRYSTGGGLSCEPKRAGHAFTRNGSANHHGRASGEPRRRAIGCTSDPAISRRTSRDHSQRPSRSSRDLFARNLRHPRTRDSSWRPLAREDGMRPDVYRSRVERRMPVCVISLGEGRRSLQAISD